MLAHRPQGHQLPSCGDHCGGGDGDESEEMSKDQYVYCAFVGARMKKWQNRENSVRYGRMWLCRGIGSCKQ